MRHNEFPTHRDPVDASHGFELRDITLSVIIRWVLFLFAFMAGSAALAYFRLSCLYSAQHDSGNRFAAAPAAHRAAKAAIAGVPEIGNARLSR